MTKTILHASLLLASIAPFAYSSAQAPPELNRSRGALLYSTHCIACHSTQAHWRDARLATDWDSLTKQVSRWERNAGLNWNEEDVSAVTHYLNSLYYHFSPGKEDKKVSSRE